MTSTGFRTQRKLVGYLGLDPRVRQSGIAPATHGHISKQGSASARVTRWSRRAGARFASPARCTRSISASVPAAGTRIAIVAAARKLACLFWCLLTRDEDYAYQQPSLTKKKLRRSRSAPAPDATGQGHRHLGHQAKRCAKPSASSPSRPRSPTRGWSATGMQPGRSGESGRERDTGARIKKALEGQSRAADHKPLTSALRSSVYSRPTSSLTPNKAPAKTPAAAGIDIAPTQKAAKFTQRTSDATKPAPHKAICGPPAQPPRPIPLPELVPKLSVQALDFHRSSKAALPFSRRRARARGTDAVVPSPLVLANTR